VLIAPHPLTPVELLSALRSGQGPDIGLTYLKRLRGPSGTADVFEILPERIDQARQIRVHAQPEALVHWLDMARTAGVADASGLLLGARPVVPARGSDVQRLADRLGAAACFRPRREGGDRVLVIEPVAGQTDCLTMSELGVASPFAEPRGAVPAG
jgi:hypothetical protein